MNQQPAQQPPVSSQTDTPTPVLSSSGSPTQQSTVPVAPPLPQVKKSSNIWLVVVVIMLILAVAGWFLYQTYINKSSNSMYEKTIDDQVSPTTTPVPSVGAVKSGDVKLDQQSQDIDENMMKIDSDLKNVDSGLNDKSVDIN